MTKRAFVNIMANEANCPFVVCMLSRPSNITAGGGDGLRNPFMSHWRVCGQRFGAHLQREEGKYYDKRDAAS